jgi:hypothetical protein
MYSCYYATTVSEQWLGKHVNNIRALARQPPPTTTEELLETVFLVESIPRLYNEEPGPAEGN